MNLTPLTAISPVDGRYRKITEILADYFSEAALIRYRILVEVEYFIALCELPLPQLKTVDEKVFDNIRSLYRNFSLDDARVVKSIESATNHDVKAVEYYLKNKFTEIGLGNYIEFIHFGLTSQDINNTAIPLSLKDFINQKYLPLYQELITTLLDRSEEWKNIPMLSHTHGQPASPTKLGKEICVFAERLTGQAELMEQIPYSAKFGGAVGNFNAHHVAYPEIDWVDFSNSLINEQFGLQRLQTTTQIEHYDNFAALCDNLKRINTILIDFNRDIWTYISKDYFKQEIKDDEVGSSAMPHKINPIDFENSEGNLGFANAIFDYLSSKLPVSRLQRDLTDSTVLRNIGVPLAHTVIAFKSLIKGMKKLIIHKQKIQEDLDNNWSVVAEAIQTVLRREAYSEPYETLKTLTRKNAAITKKTISEFIDSLSISDEIKNELRKITPSNYTGIF